MSGSYIASDSSEGNRIFSLSGPRYRQMEIRDPSCVLVRCEKTPIPGLRLAFSCCKMKFFKAYIKTLSVEGFWDRSARDTKFPDILRNITG